MTQAQAHSPTPTAAAVLDSAPTAQPASVAQSQPEAPKTPEAAADSKLSPKLQILLSREKNAVERERAANAKEAEIEAKLKRIEDFEAAKGTSPLKALELLGYSYEDLTKATLADGEVTPDVQIKKLDERLNSLVKNQEQALEREAEEAKKIAERQEQETITTFKSEIGTYVKEHGERYEFIEFDQAHELVYEVIDEHYNRTINADTGIGDVMTIATAADKVEEYLEKKYIKAKELKKVQALMGARPTPPAPKPMNPQFSQKPKTLTNNMSATQTTPQRTKPITDEERIQKAIAYARSLRS